MFSTHATGKESGEYFDNFSHMHTISEVNFRCHMKDIQRVEYHSSYAHISSPPRTGNHQPRKKQKKRLCHLQL